MSSISFIHLERVRRRSGSSNLRRIILQTDLDERQANAGWLLVEALRGAVLALRIDYLIDEYEIAGGCADLVEELRGALKEYYGTNSSGS